MTKTGPRLLLAPPSPHKALKTADGDFLQPQDRNERERASPLARKTAATSQAEPPSQLDEYAGESFVPSSSEGLTLGDIPPPRTNPRDASRSPTPARRVPLPRSSTPKPQTDVDDPMSGDDPMYGNPAHHAPAAPAPAAPAPAAPAPAAPAPALPLQPGGILQGPGGPPVPPVVVPFVRPSAAAFYQRAPRNRHLNPHLGFQTAQPAVRDNRDGVQPFQRNTGQYRKAVFTQEYLISGLEATQIPLVVNNPRMLALVMALGGQLFFSLMPNLVSELDTAFSGIVSGQDEVKFYLPLPAHIQDSSSEKYAAPGVVFMEIADPAKFDEIRDLDTVAVIKEIAFHTHVIDPNIRSWHLGTFRVNSRQDKDSLIRGLCAAIYEQMHTDEETSQQIDLMTQAGDATIAERICLVADSLDGEFLDHEDPLITIYAEPGPGTRAEDAHLRTLIRKIRYTYGHHAYTPTCDGYGAVSRCVICQYDTHLTYICPFAHSTIPKWWGPPDQMSKLTEGPLMPRGTGGGRGYGGGRGWSTRGPRGRGAPRGYRGTFGTRGGRGRGGY
ncbi:hypothetical protein B0H17DRAFT_1208935 [Mycena rosella]|uniref:Uncharacterized protein n=1 Tax=Mycena rosella TaxID=1033263 RepID=A0AAD7CZS2_MYCRO|nr:hypothetical protein B0H17DRAFT_1208935 [Mycena rosella]